MGRISSSVGLITGTPIQDTINQLINLSAVPRDRLVRRTDQLKEQRTATTDLTVLSISVQLAARAFGNATSFNQVSVKSSNAEALTVTRNGSPEVGTSRVQVLQTASTQAYRSKSFASPTRAFGTGGTLTVRGGGYVDRSESLANLNGGRGVQAGAIRVTDRSGKSAVIDLSNATTVDDVLRKINETSGINVRATSDGDAIRLLDRTGLTVSNLTVEEVGGGSTAADLGLRGINTANDRATGADILRLSSTTKLASLRDGRGLGFGADNDIRVTFRDGAALSLDFADFSREASNAKGVTNTTTDNAKLTFTARQSGASGDGFTIRFVDDPSVTQGSETVRRLESPTGPEIVFNIAAGETTAADIAAALQGDSQLSTLFTVTPSGDGAGLVSVNDVAQTSGGAAIGSIDEPTISDLLRVLNDAAPGRLRAELAPGGDSIRLLDLTSGQGQFLVTDLGTSQVAANLGLTGQPVDGVLTGRRLQSGLSTVSLDALAGGQGLGELGELDVTLGNGQTATIDLSSADSLQDVINAINESGLAVEASVDRSGSGLQVRDLSGGRNEQFTISSSDQTAQKLGIAATTSDVVIEGSSLDLQFVSRSTKLSELNQGRGVGNGSFRITNSAGLSGFISLSTQPIFNVGDLVAEINRLNLNVSASVNETGDGIRLIDNAGGNGTLKVEDNGNGTSARLLGLAGQATQQLVGGNVVSSINGRQVDQFTFTASDSLSTLADRIRNESRFVSASVSGGAGGSALNLVSRRGGNEGRMSVQSTGVDLALRQSSAGRDAVIALGGEGGSDPTILRSTDGVFTDAISGVTLTAKLATDGPVTVDVTKDRSTVEGSINRFIEQYNKLMDRVKELTFFDADSNEVGLMFGRGEMLRIQSEMSRVITTRINTGGPIRTASDVGLRLDSNGKLTLDTTKLNTLLEDSPEAVEAFFTREIERPGGSGSDGNTKLKVGFAAKVDEAVERLAGVRSGLLISRSVTLNNQIDNNDRRIESMNVRLEAERTRLLKQFVAMEAAIGKVQGNQQFLSRISYMSFDGSSR